MSQIFNHVRNELINNQCNIDCSTLNKTISSELFHTIKYLDMGVLPNSTCYLLNLPDELMYYIFKFINIREMFNIMSVCTTIQSYAINGIDRLMEYYTVGRVMYFTSRRCWMPGIIICDIDIINYETYEHHIGFHVYTMDGNVVYYPKNEIMKYSHINRIYLPHALEQPDYNGKHAPYLNEPHELCLCGKYISGCQNSRPTTALSSCAVLEPSFMPDLDENMGNIMDISTFPRHQNHATQALEIEDTYGVSFNANGVSNILYSTTRSDIRMTNRISDIMRNLNFERYPNFERYAINRIVIESDNITNNLFSDRLPEPLVDNYDDIPELEPVGSSINSDTDDDESLVAVFHTGLTSDDDDSDDMTESQSVGGNIYTTAADNGDSLVAVFNTELTSDDDDGDDTPESDHSLIFVKNT